MWLSRNITDFEKRPELSHGLRTAGLFGVNKYDASPNEVKQ